MGVAVIDPRLDKSGLVALVGQAHGGFTLPGGKHHPGTANHHAGLCAAGKQAQRGQRRASGVAETLHGQCSWARTEPALEGPAAALRAAAGFELWLTGKSACIAPTLARHRW